MLKDNYNTFDLPTTNGSLSLEGSIPPNDAFQTQKLRDAGAVILGKTNLHEFARGGTTISSLGDKHSILTIRLESLEAQVAVQAQLLLLTSPL